MIKKLFLLGFLGAMVFPANYILIRSPLISDFADYWFGNEPAHIVGHIVLFSSLVLVAAFSLNLKPNVKSAWLVMGLVLAAGGVQEIFQLRYKMRAPGWPEMFDIGVDMFGGLLGWTVFVIWANRETFLDLIFPHEGLRLFNN